MNAWQLAQQLKHELRAAVWPGGSGSPVFGTNVFVYAGNVTEDAHPPGFPFALVTVRDGVPDPDDPDLIEQTFGVQIVQSTAGDPIGEFAVIGGSRADVGASAGAGVLELASLARQTIERLTAYDGAALVVSGSGVGSPGVIGKGRQLAVAEFSVLAVCTSAPRYVAPQRLKLVGETWSWVDAGARNRFDFMRFRLGYVAGSTPVASPAELDGVVYTGSNLETPAGGVSGRVYQVFADYNGTGGDVVSGSSDAEVGSFIRL